MEPVILSQLEQEYLLRVIESANQVRDARQFFLWTQGQLQALLPHQMMLCMQFDAAGALLRLEPMHAGVLDDAAMRRLCDPSDGLAVRLGRHCRDSDRLPAMTGGAGRRAGDAMLEQYRRELQQAGFDHMVVHGSGALAGGATLFVLCGWAERPAARHAYFLALLLPYLHMALLRLAAAGPPALAPQEALARPLSARETEILRWVREGKSNFEVGCILGISALTVKNHLQRIYRALGVSNRTHALARCLALRLLEPAG